MGELLIIMSAMLMLEKLLSSSSSLERSGLVPRRRWFSVMQTHHHA